MQALLFIVIGIFLVSGVILYSFFWYEVANSNHLQYLHTISKGKLGQWLMKGIITGLVSQTLVFTFYPLVLWQKLWEPKPDPSCSRPPIFLVHGIVHNATAWIAYRWWLKRAGYNNVYCWSYNSWTCSFDELLRHFDKWYKNIMTQHFPDRKAILIGHSMGGLLIRAYESKTAPASGIGALITLAAPHGGSKLAVLALTKLAQALRYRGSLIQEIEREPLRTSISRIALFSPIDCMVLPPDALRAPEPEWTNLEAFPVSHIMMLYHRPTARLVLKHLTVLAEQLSEEPLPNKTC